MNKFLNLTREQRRTVFNETSSLIHLPVISIEKDFWVTEVLKMLFSLPYADKLVFKGGTSLSKIWGVISRFSEDIDIVIDRSMFDIEGDVTKRQLKKLRKSSSVFVRDILTNDLNEISRARGLENFIEIIADPDGKGDYTYPEPRKIHIYYKSVFENMPGRYLRDEIQLEAGARSLFEPTASARIDSYVGQQFSNLTSEDKDVEIIAAVPEKTFLEKAFLLHELFTTDNCRNANRKSRHLYDLHRMFETGIAEKAVQNDSLWETIVRHRQVFTSIRGVDYTPDVRHRVCLLPPAEVLEVWKEDYDTMVINMIYDDVKPSFGTILESAKVIEQMFRRN